jgi:hypothetical protein
LRELTTRILGNPNRPSLSLFHPMGPGIRLGALILLLAGFALARPNQVNAGTVYSVIDYFDNAGVSGTITTNGQNGDITASAITTWDVTVTVGGTTFELNPANSVHNDGDFFASASALTQAISGNVPFQFTSNDSPEDQISWTQSTNNFTMTVSSTGGTQTTDLSGSPIPVPLADAGMPSVPEPSSVVLVAIGAVCGLGTVTARSRRKEQRQWPVGPADATE